MYDLVSLVYADARQQQAGQSATMTGAGRRQDPGRTHADDASGKAGPRESSRTVPGRRPPRRKPATRPQDPEGTRRNILEIASEEFAMSGLAGARVDEIAARTRSSTRMIYYYFGDKEGLYLSALEDAYRRVREGESALDIEGRPPVEALSRLVEFTFDHHHAHEAFIRMVMIENIHRGEYLDRSEEIRNLNATAIDRIAGVYVRGVAAGDFREGIDPSSCTGR